MAATDESTIEQIQQIKIQSDRLAENSKKALGSLAELQEDIDDSIYTPAILGDNINQHDLLRLKLNLKQLIYDFASEAGTPVQQLMQLLQEQREAEDKSTKAVEMQTKSSMKK